jgi:lipoprotein-anchoring transpeptidase ErfK/SrfK/peptidoglycan hydrolase-like protein with peptidoglycan-binding domain
VLFAGPLPCVRSKNHTGTSELKAHHVTRDEARTFARKAFRISTLWLGAASLAVAVAALPADARPKKAAPVDEPIADVDKHEPMTLVISTGQQKIDVYRGTTLITSSQVSTGMAAHPTFLGVFSILEKQRWHHSNIYSGAPMPWMNRITWSGTAIHAGVVPGYPASHGCIRLLYSFAPKLFQITTVGDGVVIAKDRPAPRLIEHPALFQPIPPPPPSITEKDKPRERATELMRPLGMPNMSPVILARAEGIGETTDGMSAPTVKARPEKHAMSEPADSGDITHAIDVTEPDPNRIHAVADPTATSRGDHAIATGTSPAAAPTADHAPATPVAPAPIAAVPAVAPAPVTAPAPVVATAPSATPPEPSIPAAKVDAGADAAAAKAASPSVSMAKVTDGAKAAAVMAAEPRSNAPLRILITKRTQRDRIVGVQNILASMGYLEKQNFDGTLGRPTITAIKAFQKANDIRETGAFTDGLVKKVYEVSGQGEPPIGHLFVRQERGRLFDAPVSYKNPDEPLGTHLYTALNFAPSDTKTQWMTVTLVDSGHDPLDRIEIPDDLRQKISERLTPGSSLIIADNAINTQGLPKGGDFVVLSNYSVAKGSVSASASDQPSVEKPKVRRNRERSVRRNPYPYRYYQQPWWGLR